jgi:peptide chain release factor subunit 1
MTELDQALVRKLVDWSPGEAPVTSIYLSTDGRRYPRKQDYEVRLSEVLRGAKDAAASLPEAARRSVEGDLEEIGSFVRGRFQRGSTRGLAVFAASSAGLWEELALPRPVRNQAFVGAQANVLPLEALLETYPTTCTALVDYEKARLFCAHLGRIEEEVEVADDVPGRHDQGGRSQSRFQRHVDDHRLQHIRHVAGALLRLLERRRFDHLILAGSSDVLADLERELHDYVSRRVAARLTLPITATAAQVLDRSLQLDEELEAVREREAVSALRQAVAAGRAVTGLPGALDAISQARAAGLLVSGDLRHPGAMCPACGRLAERDGDCSACGASVRRVPDVVETAVAAALRQGSRVENVTHEALLADAGGIGAFLRF